MKKAIQEVNNQEQGFDEETKQKLQAFLEEIDAKRLQQQSSSSSLQQSEIQPVLNLQKSQSCCYKTYVLPQEY